LNARPVRSGDLRQEKFHEEIGAGVGDGMREQAVCDAGALGGW
jgi:hypothetical protein